MKKIHYAFLSVFLISCLIFFLKHDNIIENKNLIKYNPKNPTLILTGSNLSQFLIKINNENSNIFQEINKNDKINSIINHLHQIDSLIQESSDFTVSIYQNAKKANIFMAIDLKEIYKVKENIKKKYREIKFENFEEYYINNINEKLFFTIIDKTLLISSSKILIETSINQYKKNITILEDIELKKIYKKPDESNENIILINHDEIYNFKKDILKYKTKIIKPIVKWSVLDLKLETNNITLYGLSSIENNNKNYINIIKNNSAENILIDEFLPHDIISYNAICFESFDDLLKKYKKFLINNDVMFSYNKIINHETESFFNNTIQNQICKVILQSNQKEDNIFYIGRNKGLKNKFTENENLTSYIIEELKGGNIIQMILENNIYNNDFKNYIIINNYIVFGKNKSSLQYFMNVYLDDEKLINQEEYFKYKTSSIGKSNLFNYINPTKTAEYLRYNINNEYIKQSGNFEKLIGINCSYNYNNEIIFSTISLQNQPNYNKLSKVNWKIKNDTAIQKIFSFKNPQHKTKKILTQDVSNYICLYQSDGNIQAYTKKNELNGWPKKIGSKILGEISVINYYNNTNRQILFNTKDSLYIIDIYGNYIKNYPKKLKSNTNYGHTLINYKDNNWSTYHDQLYRILIKENNTINNYSKEGKIVAGWKFKTKLQNMLNPKIIHKTITKNNKNLDYIYIADNDGNIYILKRNGNNRVKINKEIPISNKNNFYVDDEGNIFSSSINGSIFKTDLKGNVKLLYENNFTKEHLFIKTDNKEKFICVDENKIFLFENNNKKNIYKIANLDAEKINLFLDDEKNTYIAIQDNNNENIHLIKYSEQKVESHLKFKGNSFSIINDLNNDDKIDITISNNNYIINYSLK